MFSQILEKFSEIISELEKLDLKERHGLKLIEAKIVLIDGSKLHVSEVWEKEELEKYSYYWLDESNNLIIGWDNAPHHLDLETFPFHKHVREQENIKPSEAKNLELVLKIIKEKID